MIIVSEPREICLPSPKMFDIISSYHINLKKLKDIFLKREPARERERERADINIASNVLTKNKECIFSIEDIKFCYDCFAFKG